MNIEEYNASMPKCKDCTGFGWGECKTAGENEVACKDFERKPKLTNADRIRQMTDEELAAFMVVQAIMGAMNVNGITGDEARKATIEIMKSGNPNDDISEAIEWLRKEVDEDAGTD